ncbi:putative flagellar hook-associated protein 3 (HAP3, flgL protein) (Hook-filament junction protein) [Bradyrhizobium sp. ORS 278]|uniref:flagellin n=1 Tax=Bradyrhizobium sp. (strain ORS 278) TaxID=114615 RepID=UPI0001508AB5|nr:flagellin [Bradyrhizobium sp. ORS 278]CAL78594.1 putative flagellar hook-associated protein 3 (HAP3, flgL protein) (Hook-filament junction protein) [Bradyrhizobium sp. ORS 278]
MAMRIATFANSDQMITNALRTQATMATLQVQEASGLKSEYLADFGADTQHIVNLQVSVTRAQSYIDAATLADSKVQVMYSAVGQVSDIVSQLRTALSAASSGTSTGTTSAISSAQQLLEQMAGILNTQYDGQYVFGGAWTLTAAVDTSSFATGTGSLSTVDTSYYQGDSELASVRVSDGQSVTYGVTADNSAFEKVMRVLKFVANSSSLSASDLSSALDLADQAVDDVATVQSNLSDSASRIESAKSQQTDFKSYAESLATDLTSVDVAAVTAQLSTYQAQLTASYSAISKIQSLNLASYLK